MFQIQCLNSKVENSTNILGKFCIEPLKKGQGVTIGNALRRVLLSDLPGLSIVGVHINNVSHEFSTIPGLKEDVIEILLNLKQIIFKGDLTEPSIARLVFQGPGVVTAQNLELPDGITLVEPCQYIGSLMARTSLEMEVLIEPGYGYLTSEQFINRLPQGFLAVDAVFMPVRKVNFFVETSRNSSFSVTESLILEVATDGSIKPMDAITNAALILEDIFASFSSTQGISSQIPKLVEETKSQNEYENIMLADLLLSVRAYNALKRANVHNLSELLKYSKEDLLEFKNFGQKSAEEVCESLQKNFGIVLAKTKN
jgi:DNA-directed RNA polymerase subunit alpha|tara:strand:+ start:825 stop:1763 length:939 start_codon:yes stop_codon:yes gene_type:complete